METRTDTTSSARRKANLKAAKTPVETLPLGCPSEVPATCPSYKSFAHIRNPKVRRAKEYEQHLLILHDLFPEYSEGLQAQLAYARSQQERNSVSDRDRVIKQLETCSLSCREVAEDLQMPYATCYKILNKFAAQGVVIIRERAGRFGNKPVCYYELAH